MKSLRNARICFVALAVLCAPAYATIQIRSMKPSLAPPQTIGTPIVWTVAASDTAAGPVTFQFNMAPPGGSMALVKDFNMGTLHSSMWSSLPFSWTPAGIEGVYQIQVVAKDFTTGESASKTLKFQVSPLVTGSNPVVIPMANPLVALFSAPSCVAGSQMRVSFQEQSGTAPAMTTSYLNCNPPNTMTFEVAGMYPSATYQMFSQTNTGGTVVNGPPVTFTTGALPSKIPFPTFQINVPAGAQTDTTDGVLLHGSVRTPYPVIATDLAGNPLWYYYKQVGFTRPLPGGGALTIANGAAWNTSSQEAQILQQIDLAGNVVKETNTGIIQQQLLAMGSVNGGSCSSVPRPPPVGAGCLGNFSHDFIQTLPNGYYAVIGDTEKIFPPGTQGNNSGLPVDIIGAMVIVMDQNLQVVWYFDAFEHDGGGTQLDINRPAVLGETCVSGQSDCRTEFLLGTGVAIKANDWLHANTLYYWPAPQNGGTMGDIIWSSRHQDWVMRINYQDGTGNGDIVWRMGNGGDFTYNNLNNDPWPWFSHQHEVGIENNGNGPMTIFDNGNTRVSPPPLGLGKGCKPRDCNSRGMAVKFSESTMQVTPVLSVDLGVFATARGSAQLLSDGNYYFSAALVVLSRTDQVEFGIEILPTLNKLTGTQVLNMEGPQTYRGWQLPDMYTPPTT